MKLFNSMGPNPHVVRMFIAELGLDIETIDILVDFIKEFKGCVILTSHDFDFLKRTVNNFFLLDGKGNISKTLNCEDIFSKNIRHKESKPPPLESFKTKGKKPESLDSPLVLIIKSISGESGE